MAAVTSFSDLPFSVLEEILTCKRLSPREILSFACVNKRCRDCALSNVIWKTLCQNKFPALSVTETDLWVEYPIGRKPDRWKKGGRDDVESLLGKEVVARLNDVKNISLARQEKREYTVNWRNVYESVWVLRIFVRRLCSVHYSLSFETDLTDEDYFEIDCLMDHVGAPFLIDALLFAIGPDRHNFFNMTDQYYSQKALRYAWVRILTERLTHVLNELDDIQAGIMKTQSWNGLTTLSETVLFLNQWSRPYQRISRSNYLSFLNEFVLDTLKYLKKNFPKHPVSETNLQNISVTDHKFPDLSYKEQGILLEAISIVICKTYYSCKRTFDISHVEGFFTIRMEEGKRHYPFFVFLFYSEVAMRFNIELKFICNGNNSYYLRWQRAETGKGSDHDDCYMVINPYEGGMQCMTDFKEERSKLVPERKVLERMCDNLTNIDIQKADKSPIRRHTILLHCLVCPLSQTPRLCRMTIFINSMSNLRVAEQDMTFLKNVIVGMQPDARKIKEKYLMQDRERKERLRTGKIKEPEPKFKSKLNVKVEFSVGMIMYHKLHKYNCIIRGWDPYCKMSPEWIKRMNVPSLSRGANQPFYQVLVDGDGSERYAAEENLVEQPHNKIDHIEVPRYFQNLITMGMLESKKATDSDKVVKKFITKYFYIPCPQVKKEYPEDSYVAIEMTDE